jgi:hypothetical protein
MSSFLPPCKRCQRGIITHCRFRNVCFHRVPLQPVARYSAVRTILGTLGVLCIGGSSAKTLWEETWRCTTIFTISKTAKFFLAFGAGEHTIQCLWQFIPLPSLQTARPVLFDAQLVNQMISDLDKIDLNTIGSHAMCSPNEQGAEIDASLNAECESPFSLN